MAFPAKKPPPVLAKALEPSEQRVAQSSSSNVQQKQRAGGSTLNDPYSFLSADKENEHVLVSTVQGTYDPVIQTSNKALCKGVTIPLVEMKSLKLVQANPIVKKKKKPVESKTLPRLSKRYGFSSPIHTVNQAPTLDSYTRTLTSLSESTDPNVGSHAYQILMNMIHDYQLKQSKVRPDACCFNIAITACKNNAKQANKVFALMWDDYTTGNVYAEPNLRVYTSILSVWSRSKATHAAERCEAILQQMQEMHDSGRLQVCKPDVVSYTIVLYAWSQSKSPQAGRRAEMLFRHMLERFRQGDQSLCPDTVTYTNLIHAYCGGPSATRAGDILWEMIGDFCNGNLSAEPDLRLFNTVLAVCSKTKCAESPFRAQEIIHKMLELNHQGVLRTKPDSCSYAYVLKSWYANGPEDAAQQSTAFIHWMNSVWSGGDDDAQVTVSHYTRVIGLWIAARNMERATDIWNEMVTSHMNDNRSAMPDVIACNRILYGWAHSQKKNATERAAEMLHHMWQLHDRGLPNIRPTVRSYNSLIYCWKHSQRRCAHTVVDGLLNEMDHFYKILRLNEPPNEISFLAAIKTWKTSQCSPETKATRILELEREIRTRFTVYNPRSDGGAK